VPARPCPVRRVVCPGLGRALPARGVWGASDGPPETREENTALDGIHQLGHTQGVRVIGHDGAFLVQAHCHVGGAMQPFQGPLDASSSARAHHSHDGDFRSEIPDRTIQSFRSNQPSPGNDRQVSQLHRSASGKGSQDDYTLVLPPHSVKGKSSPNTKSPGRVCRPGLFPQRGRGVDLTPRRSGLDVRAGCAVPSV